MLSSGLHPPSPQHALWESGEKGGTSMARATKPPPEVPVHRTATRGGTPLIVGVIEAGELRRTFTVPRRDARTKTGYQRELSPSRVNRLVKDLREDRVDLPTSILVNLRDFDPARHLVERKGRLFFRNGDDSLYVVDGQHRVEALARLVDEDGARWGGSRSRSCACSAPPSARRSGSSTS